MTDSEIMEMSATDLLFDDFMTYLCELPIIDRVRQKNIAANRAKALGIKRGFEETFKAYDDSINRQDRDRPYRDQANRFQHQNMAMGLINSGLIKRIDGGLKFKDGNIWRDDIATLNGMIIDRCQDSTKANRCEVLSWLESSKNVPVDEISPPNLIPFANGVLDLNGDDCVRPYRNSDVFPIIFPVEYDPHIEQQKYIDNMLDKVSDGSQGIRDLLHQMYGLLFFRENRYRAAFFLYGEGSNGKSTILNSVQQLIGQSNCSSMALQDWDGDRSRFRVAELAGKACNLCDDLPAKHIWDSSLFKAIVTGGRITGERKGETPFAFIPFCKLVFACNELPSASDHSGGMVSRMVAVPLTHNFADDCDFDPSVKDKRLTSAELSYLAKLAVCGLRKVIRNNGVVVPPESRALINEYQRVNDPIVGFLDYCDSIGENFIGLSTNRVYMDFREFCQREGFRGEMKQQTVIKQICKQRGLRSKLERTINGGREYQFAHKTLDEEIPF